MCAAGLQSASYWNPVEKLILHLSPVTRRKAVKALGNHQATNNNNTFHGQLHRRGRRTHSEPSTGHGSNRASLESITNGSLTHQNEQTHTRSNNNNNETRKSLSSSGHHKTLNNNSLHSHKDHAQKSNAHGLQSGTVVDIEEQNVAKRVR